MRKIIVNILAVSIILVATVFCFGYEQNLIDTVDQKEIYDNYSGSYYGAESTYGVMEYLYADSLKTLVGFNNSQLYNVTPANAVVKSNAQAIFQNYLNAWNNDVNYGQIAFASKNNLSGETRTNVQTDLFQLYNDGNIDEGYYNYCYVKFDESGNVTFEGQYPTSFGELVKTEYLKNQIEVYIVREIENSLIANNYDAEKSNISSPYLDYTDEMIMADENIVGSIEAFEDVGQQPIIDETSDFVTFELKPIQNMEYVFAYSKGLNGEVSHYSYYWFVNDQMFYAIPFIGIVGLVVMILALFFPIKITKESWFFKNIKHIKVEVWVLVAGLMCVIIYALPNMLTEAYFNTFAKEIIKVINDVNVANSIQNFIIFTQVLILMFAAFVLGFMLRYVFHKNIFKYLAANSLIIEGIIYIFNIIKRYLNDLSGMYSNNIFSKANILATCAIGLNGLVMLSYGANIVLVLGYSLFLLIVYLYVYHNANRDYSKLKEITSDIAKGDLDITINADLGMYNDIRDDLSNIKTNFSKAVFEEVKSQQMKTELIANVSHDLKTPLTNIITYTDLLKIENKSKEDEQAYIEVVDRNAKRLKNLIDDLFEVSKLNSGEIDLDIQRVDVNSMLKEIYLEWEEKFNQRNLITRFNFNPEKIYLNLDSYKSHRIFENLINNMYKYALENTRVYIEGNMTNDGYRLEFKNISSTEINFSANDATDRFVRGDASRNTEGSGLGLAIAKSLVELHGGKIEVVIDGDLFKVVILFTNIAE